VPLYVDLGTSIWNITIATLAMAFAGAITAWDASAIRGAIIGAAVIAGFYFLRAVVPTAMVTGQWGMMVAFIPLILPSALFSLIITALLRLAVQSTENAFAYSGRPRLFRLGQVVLGVLVVSLVGGSLAQMSKAEQDAVKRVDQMLNRAFTAQTTKDVPGSVRALNLRDRATATYTLDAMTDISADKSIAGSIAEQTIIVKVYFANGFEMDCLVLNESAPPVCSETEQAAR
jgi:hypothetical protein